MPDLVLEAVAERSCAAPRESILAWDIDPKNLAAADPRLKAFGFELDQRGLAKSWTTTARLFKVIPVRFHSVVTSNDPQVVEVRGPRQIHENTVRVAAEPDAAGNFQVTCRCRMVVKQPFRSKADVARRQVRFGERLQAALESQLDKTVSCVEAATHAAATATGQD